MFKRTGSVEDSGNIEIANRRKIFVHSGSRMDRTDTGGNIPDMFLRTERGIHCENQRRRMSFFDAGKRRFQIEGVNRQVAMGDFPVMVTSLSGGRIDGYVSERPGAMSAVAANPNLTFLSFEEGKGFEIDPEETIISVAVRQDSPLLEQINAALANLTEEARLELMAQALERQPGDN